MRRRFKKYVIEGSKYAHWIGLYLRFHLNRVLGPLQTSEVTFAHVIASLKTVLATKELSIIEDEHLTFTDMLNK